MTFDLERFEREGFVITEPLLPCSKVSELIRLVERASSPGCELRRGGVRDVLECVPELKALADCGSVRAIVEKVLGPGALVVRATLFDKTDAANWKVPWHQDLTIAVNERHDAPGYGPWSTKAGVRHVQPPAEVLERMVTVRIHLDDCPATNGALRVLPGTHRLGRLNQNHVDEHVHEELVVTCAADAGEALVMRPLLLHASSLSINPNHRRVVHFDFAVGELAQGLSWKMGK